MFKEKNNKFIIIDDHPIYVQGLEYALMGSLYLQHVGSFIDSSEAKAFLGSHPVDIVICDVNMQKYNDFDKLKYIRERKLDVKFQFLSGFSDYFTVNRAYKLGVHSFLSKEAPLVELFKSLDTIRKGGIYTNEAIDMVLQSNATGISVGKMYRPLTRRKEIVLRKICEEKTSSEIAKELGISIHTVNNHRKSILKKTNCTNLVSLTKFAAQNGLL